MPQRLFFSATVPAATAAGAALMAWAVRGRAARVFGPSVWRGPRERRAIALTFDDGPSEATPEILSVLAAYAVPATFFHIGANVERLPEVVRAAAAAGHEIGNHGYGHRLYCFRPAADIAHDMYRAQTAIHRHAGVQPVLFRPPFGVRWFGLRRAQRELGLLGVMWTVIGRDWKLDAGGVTSRVAARVANGSIVCLHDGRGLEPRPDARATVEAVRRLVPLLLDRGYRFETVSRLLHPEPPTSTST